MMRRTRISSGSTSAVLWLMILLVFLPIAVGHVIARRGTDDDPERAAAHGSGAVQVQESRRAG
jgi:hypothetical protein